MFINPIMLEPATASIAVYLLAKTPFDINRNRRLLLRRPYYLKKKVCKWVLYNKNELADRIIDESSDYLIDTLNIIKIINMNPSIFVIIYVLLLFMIILL